MSSLAATKQDTKQDQCDQGHDSMSYTNNSKHVVFEDHLPVPEVLARKVSNMLPPRRSKSVGQSFANFFAVYVISTFNNCIFSARDIQPQPSSPNEPESVSPPESQPSFTFMSSSQVNIPIEDRIGRMILWLLIAY